MFEHLYWIVIQKLASMKPLFMHSSICFHNENIHHYQSTIMLIKCKLSQGHNYNNNMWNCHEKHKSYKTPYSSEPHNLENWSGIYLKNKSVKLTYLKIDNLVSLGNLKIMENIKISKNKSWFIWGYLKIAVSIKISKIYFKN